MQHHLLWVWADAGPNAQLECLSKQPAIVEELLHDDQVLYVHPWYAAFTISWDVCKVIVTVMTHLRV